MKHNDISTIKTIRSPTANLNGTIVSDDFGSGNCVRHLVTLQCKQLVRRSTGIS